MPSAPTSTSYFSVVPSVKLRVTPVSSCSKDVTFLLTWSVPGGSAASRRS